MCGETSVPLRRRHIRAFGHEKSRRDCSRRLRKAKSQQFRLALLFGHATHHARTMRSPFIKQAEQACCLVPPFGSPSTIVIPVISTTTSRQPHRGHWSRSCAFCVRLTRSSTRCFGVAGGGDPTITVNRAMQTIIALLVQMLLHLVSAIDPESGTGPCHCRTGPIPGHPRVAACRDSGPECRPAAPHSASSAILHR